MIEIVAATTIIAWVVPDPLWNSYLCQPQQQGVGRGVERVGARGDESHNDNVWIVIVHDKQIHPLLTLERAQAKAVRAQTVLCAA